jgi:hypothetical protein
VYEAWTRLVYCSERAGANCGEKAEGAREGEQLAAGAKSKGETRLTKGGNQVVSEWNVRH